MATAYTPLRRGTHRRGSRSCVQPALAHSPVQASTLALNRVLVSPTGFHGGGLAEKSGRDRRTRWTDQMIAPPTLLIGQKGAAGLIWPVERRDSRVWPVVSKSSRAWPRRAGSAQGTRPSALPGSMVVFGCFSHQPDAPTCHPQRGKPVATGGGGVPKAHRTRVWPAAMAPRLAGLRADDAVASHRAADGVGPSIEGARTYAHATPRGAVAVLSAFCPRSAAYISALSSLPRPLPSRARTV